MSDNDDNKRYNTAVCNHKCQQLLQNYLNGLQDNLR